MIAPENEATFLSPEDPGFAEAMAVCMEDRGFPTEVLPDGSLRGSHSPEQAQLAFETNEACLVELTGRGFGLSDSPPDDETFGMWFDAHVLAMECIEGLGYDLDSPPSREAYVQSRGELWNPYDEVDLRIVGVDAWEAIDSECQITDFMEEVGAR